MMDGMTGDVAAGTTGVAGSLEDDDDDDWRPATSKTRFSKSTRTTGGPEWKAERVSDETGFGRSHLGRLHTASVLSNEHDLPRTKPNK
jgi:hypothetical protein